MTTVVAGGRVLSADCARLDELDLLIDGGVIVALAPRGALATVDADVIDASGCLVTPGFVNGHTHSHAGILTGVAREWTLEHSLLNGAWMSAPRSEELTRLSAQLVATELLASGCTALFDLAARSPVPSVDSLLAVADSYSRVGIRAVLAPMVSDLPLSRSVPALVFPEECGGGVVAGATEEILRACRAVVEAWPYDPAIIAPALAPTVPAACTPDLFAALLDLAREHGLRLHTHLAESKPQAMAGAGLFGRSITAELSRRDALGPWLTAAHVIWTSEADNDLLAAAGVTAVTVPASNLRLGSGVQDSRALLEAGVTLAIGTDGANSSDALDMVDGIRLTSLLSRVSERPASEWLTVPEVLRAATSGGASALGWGGRLGVLAPGFAADVVLHDLGATTYVPLTDPLNQLVTAGRASDVRTVLVDGRIVYDRGAYPGSDVAALRARASDLAAAHLEEHAGARAETARVALASAASLAAARRSAWPVQRLLPGGPTPAEPSGYP